MYYNAPPSPGPGQQPWTRGHHPVLGGVGLSQQGPVGVLPPTPSPAGFGAMQAQLQGYGPQTQGPLHHQILSHQQQHPINHHQHHPSLSQQQPWASPTTQHTMQGGVGVGMGGMGMQGSAGFGAVGSGVGGMGQAQMRPQSPGELTKYWQEQLKVAHMSRLASAPHARARQSAFTARAQTTKQVIQITDPNAPRPPSAAAQISSNTPNPYPGPSSTPAAPGLTNGFNGHGHHAQASSISSMSSVDPAIKFNHPSGTVPPVNSHPPQAQPVNGTNGASLTNVVTITEGPPALPSKQEDFNPWTTLDMGGMQLKSVSARLYTFTYLKTLYMNHNRLTTLPPAIGVLKQLVHLDLTQNMLHTLPPEIGQLTSLKELLLFDNALTELPHELGTLHQLELLGIEGNPLPPDIRHTLQKDGTAAVIAMLRDSAPLPPPPPQRPWHDLPLPGDASDGEAFTVINYNVLCQWYAPASMYGYTPSWALRWEFRRQLVLDEITSYNADIVCLQEVDGAQYEEFFLEKLSALGYDGVYWQKARARTMSRDESRRVDGCATFFKRDRFQLIEKQLVDYSAIAVQRQDFKKTDELFSRVLSRDHIGTVTLLEDRRTGTRLVLANTHIYWDPTYSDVKLVQTGILMDEIEKVASRFATLPPKLIISPDTIPLPQETPSPGSTSISQLEGEGEMSSSVGAEKMNGVEHAETSTEALFDNPASTASSSPVKKALPVIMRGTPMGPTYADGTKIPTIICGDFNSIPGSGVYEFLSSGHVPMDHPEFMHFNHQALTAKGMTHRLKLRSAYEDVPQMTMTNYTPSFEGVIDYIWYSTDTLAVRSVLGEVDPGYLVKSVGFPNAHFPSDHLCLAAEFRLKAQPRQSTALKVRPTFFPNGRGRKDKD